ncbi:MAG: flagellar motor protein MotA, partial [Methanosphaera sp. rholeuAM74]
MAAVPGGEILSGILNVVAESLLIPVMILLVIFIIFAVIEIGALLSEYTSRHKITGKEKEILIKNISACTTPDQISQVIFHTNMNKYDKEILTSIAQLDKTVYNKKTRETLARNLLEEQEFKVNQTLEKVDIVSKVGSACGLLGTIIPMGPGLAALGAGDMQTLTTSLTTAFNTTT